jgi:hypothetical protein
VSKFLDFIEYHWGLIDGSWRLKDKHGVQVLRFKNTPLPNLYTYMTLGVSNSVLELENKLMRQEYLIVSNSQKEDEIVSFLFSFSEMIINQNRAVKRGEIFDPLNDWFSIPEIKGIYSCYPILISEEQGVYVKHTPKTTFVQLIPILKEDIELIKSYKGINFENVLIEDNMNFWNFKRDSFKISK